MYCTFSHIEHESTTDAEAGMRNRFFILFSSLVMYLFDFGFYVILVLTATPMAYALLFHSNHFIIIS